MTVPFSISYAECRSQFLDATSHATAHEQHVINARGPHDEELTIDVAVLGTPDADRALMVMAGVHGVEGFTASPIMCEAARRWSRPDVDLDGVTVLLVHAVNPWGMAWWRRQNESNVDLNRNWGADSHGLIGQNYAAVHDALCPTDDQLPGDDGFLAALAPVVEAHGEPWVRAAVSDGQNTHPDGLYFAGDRPAESTQIMADLAARRLGHAADIVVVDLHTGFGPSGTMTLLARCEPGSDADAWTRRVFDGISVHNTLTAGDPPPRTGQIAGGLTEVAPHATFHAVTAEMGTRSDITMILAERAEHWVHRFGDRSNPDHARVLDHHLRCSTPAAADWQEAALAQGRHVLDAALDATRP